MRCPMGKKTKYYKRAKLEKFAHYLMKDGLVCRLSVYDDKERKSPSSSQLDSVNKIVLNFSFEYISIL